MENVVFITKRTKTNDEQEIRDMTPSDDIDFEKSKTWPKFNQRFKYLLMKNYQIDCSDYIKNTNTDYIRKYYNEGYSVNISVDLFVQEHRSKINQL